MRSRCRRRAGFNWRGEETYLSSPSSDANTFCRIASFVFLVLFLFDSSFLFLSSPPHPNRPRSPRSARLFFLSHSSPPRSLTRVVSISPAAHRCAASAHRQQQLEVLAAAVGPPIAYSCVGHPRTLTRAAVKSFRNHDQLVSNLIHSTTQDRFDSYAWMCEHLR